MYYLDTSATYLHFSAQYIKTAAILANKIVLIYVNFLQRHISIKASLKRLKV